MSPISNTLGSLPQYIIGSVCGSANILARISVAKISQIGLVAFAVFALESIQTAAAGPMAYHACVMGCLAVPAMFAPCLAGCQILRFMPGP